MRTREDIEAYLARSSYDATELEENTWLVTERAPSTSSPRENIVVRLAGELVFFRVNVLDLEAVEPSRREGFFATLLELNATDMVHGAYGLQRHDGGPTKVLLTAAHRLSDLDYSELVGTLDDFTVALAKHHERFAAFHRS